MTGPSSLPPFLPPRARLSRRLRPLQTRSGVGCPRDTPAALRRSPLSFSLRWSVSSPSVPPPSPSVVTPRKGRVLWWENASQWLDLIMRSHSSLQEEARDAEDLLVPIRVCTSHSSLRCPSAPQRIESPRTTAGCLLSRLFLCGQDDQSY